MTQEEKAKAYNELVGEIKKAYLYAQTDSTKAVLEDILPELKESEDERIRKALIRFHKSSIDIDGIKGEDIISWLEKQGQETMKVSIWKHWKDGIAGNGNGEPIFLIKSGNTYTLSSGLSFECDYIELSELDNLMLEKQDKKDNQVKLPPFTFDDILALQCCMETAKNVQEDKELYKALLILHDKLYDAYELGKQGVQKETLCDKCKKEQPSHSCQVITALGRCYIEGINKVKPKFKVGDWITDGDLHCKISDILDDRYIVDTKFKKRSAIPFRRENNYHLWTIEDAKDGDVLVASDGSIFLFKGTIDYACIHYVALATDGTVVFNEGLEHFWENSTAVHPSTKEQRDLLFQKMKDNGYEWNADKKELIIEEFDICI